MRNICIKTNHLGGDPVQVKTKKGNMYKLTPYEETQFEYILDWANGKLFPWYQNDEVKEKVLEASKNNDKIFVITTTAQNDRWLLDSIRDEMNRTYINTYLINRAYGGPEEGGWWYDVSVPVESVYFETIEQAIQQFHYYENKWKRTNHDEGRIHESSVNSDGYYYTFREHHFAEYSPKERPRYE